MQQSTDQSPSMTGSDTGEFTGPWTSHDTLLSSRLESDPDLQLLILTQVNWELEAELRLQNQLTYLDTAIAEEVNMRDVKNAASTIKDFVAKIQKVTADAQSAFLSEGNNAITNAGNLMAAAGDLKDANKMMEEALGATGSNFPDLSQPSAASSATSTKADSNGVTLNPAHVNGTADTNGVVLNKG